MPNLVDMKLASKMPDLVDIGQSLDRAYREMPPLEKIGSEASRHIECGEHEVEDYDSGSDSIDVDEEETEEDQHAVDNDEAGGANNGNAGGNEEGMDIDQEENNEGVNDDNEMNRLDAKFDDMFDARFGTRFDADSREQRRRYAEAYMNAKTTQSKPVRTESTPKFGISHVSSKAEFENHVKSHAPSKQLYDWVKAQNEARLKGVKLNKVQEPKIVVVLSPATKFTERNLAALKKQGQTLESFIAVKQQLAEKGMVHTVPAEEFEEIKRTGSVSQGSLKVNPDKNRVKVRGIKSELKNVLFYEQTPNTIYVLQDANVMGNK